MPTLQVYLPETDYAKLVRIAEGKSLTGAQLAAAVLGRLVQRDSRKIRSLFELPEP